MELCWTYDGLMLDICWKFAGHLLDLRRTYAEIMLEYCWNAGGMLLERQQRNAMLTKCSDTSEMLDAKEMTWRSAGMLLNCLSQEVLCNAIAAWGRALLFGAPSGGVGCEAPATALSATPVTSSAA